MTAPALPPFPLSVLTRIKFPTARISTTQVLKSERILSERPFSPLATVRGELKHYPKFLEFGINTSKTWEPVQLSKFFKMNRAFFKDAQYNMELVTVLKNFKASIDSKVENSRQDNGSRTDNYSQVVNSNLPASFNLIVPIFKGRPAEEIEVEIIADVDGRNIRLSLCSPGAEVIVEEERNKAIDEQLLLIRKLAPDIAIIEQ